MYVTGVSGTAQVGTVSTNAKATVYLTGVQATGRLGTAQVDAKATVYPTGVRGITQVGQVTTSAKATVYPTGVQGTAILNNDVLVWSEVDDAQVVDWVDVLANPVTTIEVIDNYGGATFGEVAIAGNYDIRFRYQPTSSWTPVADAQDANWTKIAA